MTKEETPDTSESKAYRVKNDEGRDLRFRGIRVAEVTSQDHNSTRWTILRLYATDSDKYVVSVIGRTQWQGETDRHAAYVCDDQAGVIAALEADNGGYLGSLAKELLKEAEIDAAREV